MKPYTPLALLTLMFSMHAKLLAAEEIAYPAAYPQWLHVKSMLIQPNHPLANPFAGIHHVYANDLAAEGLASGKFADGASLAFDLFEADSGADAITEGKRKLLGVMIKNANQFSKTGGWGFQAFAGDSHAERLVTDGGLSCFGCHTQVQQSSFVFSKLRD